MSTPILFSPSYGTTVSVSATSSASAATNLIIGDLGVQIINIGTKMGFVKVCAAGNATSADYPVNAGETVIITKAAAFNRISYISADGTTLLITSGMPQ